MILQTDKTFDEYILLGNETTEELLAADGAPIRALRELHDFFGQTLWAQGADLDPFSSVLSLNAFMMWLAGTRVALSGHASAIFPVLRTALEYACYAFLITDDPALGKVWANRHDSEASYKASREAFTAAVRITARKLNQIQPDSGDWILEAYQAGIDFGGHPNPKGVFLHAKMEDADPEFHRLSLTGLYAADHGETQRALLASFEFGLAIAVVLMRCRGDYSETIESALNKLIELADELVATIRGEAAVGKGSS